MFVAVVIVFLLGQTWQISAEPDKVKYIRCSDSSRNDTSMTFERSADGVEGRYTAELCSLKNPNWTSWNIDLTYYDDPKFCSKRSQKPGPQHSANTLDIDDPTNCTHVCYAMNFDLIFTSCYGIKSTFKAGKRTFAPHDSCHNISNNLTKDYLSKNHPHVAPFDHSEGVTLHWFLGIPPTEFNVGLYSNSTMNPGYAEDVTQNCSVYNTKEVHCFLTPPYGCYRAILEHEAPWTTGAFSSQKYVRFDFCHAAVRAPELAGRSPAVVWACGAVLAAACALAAAAALRAGLRARAYHKHVLDAWTQRRRAREAEGLPVVGEAEAGARPVLLLYARDGERGERAVAALRDLVREATGEMVYDLFSAEVVALSAAAPGGWLRALLRRRGLRVLLLQTPALAALYRAELSDQPAGLKLAEPLLGRRVTYRSPQFGDSLLQMALRLIAETASEHHAYHKYYLASWSGLATDIMPQVVPYRRYVLPDSAAALAADLAGPGDLPPSPGGLPPSPGGLPLSLGGLPPSPGGLPPSPGGLPPSPGGLPPSPGGLPPSPGGLPALAHAARDFLQHATEHPDYLMDELIFM